MAQCRQLVFQLLDGGTAFFLLAGCFCRILFTGFQHPFQILQFLPGFFQLFIFACLILSEFFHFTGKHRFYIQRLGSLCAQIVQFIAKTFQFLLFLRIQ